MAKRGGGRPKPGGEDCNLLSNNINYKLILDNTAKKLFVRLIKAFVLVNFLYSKFLVKVSLLNSSASEVLVTDLWSGRRGGERG